MIVKLAAPNFEKNLYVESFREASSACSLFIETAELSSEAWEGGQVFTDDGKQVGNIAYNGRIFDMEGKEVPVILAAASIAAKSLRAIPSDVRAQTSRVNGKKGGRPRKVR
jgi:hypothetical protein